MSVESEVLDARRAQHPPFLRALLADTRVARANQGRPLGEASTAEQLKAAAELAYRSDAFLAMALYRAKARLQTHRVPLLPRLLHRLAIAIAQISIGDPVVVKPGVYLAHGQVVIDGFTEVAQGVVISPFVTVGLIAGEFRGPTIGAEARIGSGARVLGPISIGERARIGANAVVLQDVPDDATAVGVPATVR